jgi:integrase
MIEVITKILRELTPEDIEKLKLLSQIFNGNNFQKPVKEITTEQGLLECEKLGEFNKEPKTVSLMKTANRQFLKHIPGNRMLNTIDERDAEYLFKEQSKTAPKGVFNYNKVYHAEFNELKKLGYISNNPFDLKLPELQEEEPVVIPDEHINAITDKLNENNKPIIADMVVLAVNSGLRLSEQVFLRRCDIDLKKNVMTIGSKHFKTKTKKIRWVPLNPLMEEIIRRNLDRQMKKNKIISEFVFAQNSGKPYSTDTVSRAFKKAVRALELPEEYQWKSQRSTAASNWANKKVPIYTVQKLLGHTKTSTTCKHYARVNLDELRDAINSL